MQEMMRKPAQLAINTASIACGQCQTCSLQGGCVVASAVSCPLLLPKTVLY